MKKLLILGMMVLFLSSLIAVESEPSDVVGFVKIEAQNNNYTAFALPFDLDGESIPDMFGGANPIINGGFPSSVADEIIEQGTGSSAWFKIGGPGPQNVWTGSLTVADEERAYQLKNLGAESIIFYLCGKVSTDNVSFTFDFPANAYTSLGFREASAVSVEDLGLLEAGFTGGFPAGLADELIEQGTGNTAWYKVGGPGPQNIWTGGLTELTPGKAYTIKIVNGNPGISGYTYVHPTVRSKNTNRKNNKRSGK